MTVGLVLDFGVLDGSEAVEGLYPRICKNQDTPTQPEGLASRHDSFQSGEMWLVRYIIWLVGTS